MKLVQVASNITGALELDEEGQPVVTKSYERKGWVLLQELYNREGRVDLWSAWKAHRSATLEARKDGLSTPSWPDKFLPKEVQRRRAGHRPASTAYVLPELAPVDLSEDEIEPAPAPGPKKGRKAKMDPEPTPEA
ncbi:hypothetical protein [Nannocystis pusilla]|uniref:hypothetical protein n=1 Tax=Nannocystis pusilla TaxID=889268 RepID=UPI003DA535B5